MSDRQQYSAFRGADCPASPSVRESLDYLVDLTGEMRKLAERSGCSRLAVILNLAEQEAREQQRQFQLQLHS